MIYHLQSETILDLVCHGLQKSGAIEDYALADLYAWLEAHSGFH